MVNKFSENGKALTGAEFAAKWAIMMCGTFIVDGRINHRTILSSDNLFTRGSWQIVKNGQIIRSVSAFSSAFYTWSTYVKHDVDSTYELEYSENAIQSGNQH